MIFESVLSLDLVNAEKSNVMRLLVLCKDKNHSPR
jgi:hypothetical protein